MKRLSLLAIVATVLLSTATSYAWICTFTGPMGANYSRGGGGFGRAAAYSNALAACRANKVHNGVPCAFRGCVR